MQTICQCGHSLAAHRNGRCIGVFFIGPAAPRQRVHAVELCACPAMRKAAR